MPGTKQNRLIYFSIIQHTSIRIFPEYEMVLFPVLIVRLDLLAQIVDALWCPSECHLLQLNEGSVYDGSLSKSSQNVFLNFTL